MAESSPTGASPAPTRRAFNDLHAKDQAVKQAKKMCIEQAWGVKIDDLLPYEIRPRVERRKGAKARMGDIDPGHEAWWNWSCELLRALDELSSLLPNELEYARELLQIEVEHRQANPKSPQRKILELLLGDAQRVVDETRRRLADANDQDNAKTLYEQDNAKTTYSQEAPKPVYVQQPAPVVTSPLNPYAMYQQNRLSMTPQLQPQQLRSGSFDNGMSGLQGNAMSHDGLIAPQAQMTSSAMHSFMQPPARPDRQALLNKLHNFEHELHGAHARVEQAQHHLADTQREANDLQHRVDELRHQLAAQ